MYHILFVIPLLSCTEVKISYILYSQSEAYAVPSKNKTRTDCDSNNDFPYYQIELKIEK